MEILLKYLGFRFDKGKIKAIIEKHAFKKETGRARGNEDARSFKRKAISGEYKSVFTQEQKQIASEHAKDVLKNLKYDLI